MKLFFIVAFQKLKILGLTGFLCLYIGLAFGQDLTNHYLYVGRSPKNRNGFRTLQPSIEVYDIDHGHKLVKVIPLPQNVMNIRAMFASVANQSIYISYYGTFNSSETGYMLCMDLITEKIIWNKQYESAVDRGTITPDGKKIFMPSGEDTHTDYFYVIDAATGEEQPQERIPVAPRTHNTITSADNSKVFMSAFGTAMNYNWLHVVDTRTNKTIRKIGPCYAVIRPFTINGKATLAFITTNRLIGFEVGDVQTGKILFSSNVPKQYALPPDIKNSTYSHGIALTTDEKEVWVVDEKKYGIHIFDVSGLPGKAPVWKMFLPTAKGDEKDASGNFVYGEEGIYGQPAWLMGSISGKYIYPESGEIIDTQQKKVIGQLKGANGKFAHSRFAIEVDISNGKVTDCGDQFVVGRVTR